MAYTTADFVSSVERRSFAPTGQQTYTSTEILAVGDEEIKTRILPNILAVREEFFVFYKDYTITTNQQAYDIPARAVGMIARDVHIIDTNQSVTPLPRIEPENVTSYVTGNPTAHYLRGNQVLLDRIPSATLGTLRIYFFLRPGKMVAVASGAVISAINTLTNAITVTTIPSTWATGNYFDLIKQDGGHEYLSIDNLSSSVLSNVITLSSLPSTLRVGDYVSLAGESPLVQLPPDYQPVLAQLTAANILESTNQPGADKASKKADLLLEAAQKMITPRVQGADRVILPVNWT